VTFVGNKHPVAIGHEVDEFEGVDPVIQRAGEVEVRCDQFLNRRAILRDIRFVSSARDRDNIICPGDFFLGRSLSCFQLLRLSFSSLPLFFDWFLA